MRISDWSSDVCSSDLDRHRHPRRRRSAARSAGVASPRGCRRDRRRRYRAAAQHRGGGIVIADTATRPAGDPSLARRLTAGALLAPVALVGGVQDRKSVVEGKSVSVSVDLGGRRIIKKQKDTTSIHI